MPNVQTNWHLDGLDDDDGDPMQEMTEIIQEAVPIDVSKGTAELHEDIRRLLRREERLANGGWECPLKWSSQHYLMGGETVMCQSCPHRRTDPDDPCTAVCRIGALQEATTAALEGAKAVEAMDAELFEAVERDDAIRAEHADYALAAA